MRHILLSIGMVVTLSACGDPLRNVARLSDVTVDGGGCDRCAHADRSDQHAWWFVQPPFEPNSRRSHKCCRGKPRWPIRLSVTLQTSRRHLPLLLMQPRKPRRIVRARGLPDCSAATPTARQFRAQGPTRKMSKREQSCPLVRSRAFAGCAPMNLAPKSTRAANFRVYDTIPNSTAPRPFYITGFSDDCCAHVYRVLWS